LPQEKKSNEPIKVTDKRIFTADGDIKDEYRDQVTPIDPSQAREQEPAQAPADVQTTAKPPDASDSEHVTDRRFLTLLQLLADTVIQNLDYARRGMPEAREGARQFIDMLEALEEKTAGNLSLEEAGNVKRLLGELKLLFMQVTKGLKV
jgi:hypothetical protein